MSRWHKHAEYANAGWQTLRPRAAFCVSMAQHRWRLSTRRIDAVSERSTTPAELHACLPATQHASGVSLLLSCDLPMAVQAP